MPDYATAEIDPSQSTLSANFGPYVNQMLARGWGLAELDYTPFEGTRYAGTQPILESAFRGFENLQTPGQFQQATGIASQAAQQAQGLQYSPEKYASQSFTGPGIAQAYMSPYMQAVVDIQQREAQRQADIAGTQRGAKFAQAGAFGGSRQAIENAEAERNLQTRMGDIQATGLQSAFQQAQQQFNAEEQARRNAQQLSEQSRQYGAGYGLQGLQQQLSAAQLLGGLGAQQGQSQLAGLQGMLTAGQQQQTLAQQPLDFGYSQWQESMKYPYQQTSYMQSLLSGLPLESTAYSPAGSGFGSALQGGLAGLGLYQALNK